MQFASAVSRREKTHEAAQQIVSSLRQQLPGPLDLLAVFFTPDHRDKAKELSACLRRELSPRLLIGCMGEGVIGGEREIEDDPGITALAGRLPGVSLSPFHIASEEWEETLDEAKEHRLRRRLGMASSILDETRAFLVLGDPFTTPIAEFMERLDACSPGVPVVGGMASGGHRPGQNALLLQDEVWEEGAVGVRIAGPVQIVTVVSQGCRPVGETMLVTKAEGNRVETFGGRNALEAARAMLRSLPDEEQERIENGLFLGVVINEYQPSFEQGDFLVRSVLGAEPDSGAVVLGETVRAGQTVQFHVRDAQTADEDLRLLLTRAARKESAPAGGFLFSCNGRGLRMFETPNHDVRGVLEVVPETPLAGFFAQGELGPVGGKSFIHGHTASIVLFHPVEEKK